MSGTSADDDFRLFTPHLRTDILLDHGGNDAVVWAPNRHEPTYLDPMSTLLLDTFDGTATAQDVAGDVQAVFEIEEEDANNQVARVLFLYKEAGLLDSDESSVAALEPYMLAPDW